MMKQKLEDLMAKATPGPIILSDIFADARLMDKEGLVAVVAGPSNRPTNRNREFSNAALLAHWYNNGPKLLEALKNALPWLYAEKGNPGGPYETARAAIAAAQEVET